MTDFPDFAFRGMTSSSDYGFAEKKNGTLSKDEGLKKLRELIAGNEDSNFTNLEDGFLLRFLNARKMNVDESFTLLNNYFSYRERNKEVFDNLSIDDPLIKQAVYEGFPGVLPEKDRGIWTPPSLSIITSIGWNSEQYDPILSSSRKGRCVLVFFCNNWEQANYPLEVVYRSLLITLESLLEEPANQVNGFVMIVDWTDVTFSQVMSISPRMLRLMVEGLQDCFPARFKGVHFLNQPWYIERILTVIKTFLKEKTSKKIYVHGNNLSSLHSHVTPAILPSELGGECPPFSPTPWAHTLSTHRGID